MASDKWKQNTPWGLILDISGEVHTIESCCTHKELREKRERREGEREKRERREGERETDSKREGEKKA